MHLKISSVKWQPFCPGGDELTHWGWVTNICVGNLTIIGSDNGLLPGRRQAIIWTNAGILLIGPLGTNFSGLLIEIQTFSFKKKHLKVSSAKLRPFCLGLNVLTRHRHQVMEWYIRHLCQERLHCWLTGTEDKKIRWIVVCILNISKPFSFYMIYRNGTYKAYNETHHSMKYWIKYQC